MKIKTEKITINGNEFMIKERVMMNNKPVKHKNKKKLKNKYKCRKRVPVV